MAKGDGKSKGHGKACHGCHGKIMEKSHAALEILKTSENSDENCELLWAAVEICTSSRHAICISRITIRIHSPERNRLHVPCISSAGAFGFRTGPRGARGEPKVQDGSLHLPHERSMRLLSGYGWFSEKRHMENSPLIDDLYVEYW